MLLINTKLVCDYDVVSCPFLLQQVAEEIERNTILDGLANQEFKLYLQPQVDERGKIKRAEGLLRWEHNGKILGPEYFIPFAERDKQGLIKIIGREVLRLAAEVLTRWANIPGFTDIKLAVNISPKELTYDFFEYLAGIINAGAINPKLLIIEITEAPLELEKIAEASTVLDRINNELKIKLSMDDCGTDGASLQRWSQDPYEEIKLDRSLLLGLSHNNPRIQKRTKNIIKMLIDNANQNACLTVVEGIEQKTEYELFYDLGVDFFQGYWFSKPIDEKAFTELLSRDIAFSPR